MHYISDAADKSASQVAGLIASVDWFTTTTKTGQASAHMVESLVEAIKDDPQFYAQGKRWRFMGFSGHQHGEVRYGIRGDEAIAMVHGAQAHSLYRTVCPHAENCTRLDLCVTTALARPNKDVAWEAYQLTQNAGTKQARHFQSSVGGSTCYVGSRHSRWMGRLYDKGAHLKTEAGLMWRYELEIKKPASWLVLNALLNQADDQTYISAEVWRWFTEEGIICPWSPTSQHNAIEIPRSVPDDEKSLLWLAKSVKPVVSRLVAGGRYTEVYRALGLVSPREVEAMLALKEKI